MKKDLSLLDAEVLVYNCNIFSKDNDFKPSTLITGVNQKN